MALAAVLDPTFERRVHVLVPAPGGATQGSPQEGEQQPSEALALDQAHPLGPKGFDQEGVLAVQDSREPEAAEPTQLPLGRHADDDRPERHWLLAGRPDRHFQAPPLAQVAGHVGDERVPLWVLVETCEHLPDSGEGAGDLDLGAISRIPPSAAELLSIWKCVHITLPNSPVRHARSNPPLGLLIWKFFSIIAQIRVLYCQAFRPHGPWQVTA